MRSLDAFTEAYARLYNIDATKVQETVVILERVVGQIHLPAGSKVTRGQLREACTDGMLYHAETRTRGRRFPIPQMWEANFITRCRGVIAHGLSPRRG